MTAPACGCNAVAHMTGGYHAQDCPEHPGELMRPAPADAAPSPEEMAEAYYGPEDDPAGVTCRRGFARGVAAERARAAAREQEQASRHRAELLSAAGLTRELAGEVERLRARLAWREAVGRYHAALDTLDPAKIEAAAQAVHAKADAVRALEPGAFDEPA